MSCSDRSFGTVPYDLQPSNIKINTSLSSANVVSCRADIVDANILTAYIDNAIVNNLTVLNSEVVPPVIPPRLIMGDDSSLQFGSFGNTGGVVGNDSYAYFGTQLGIVNPDPTNAARLLPVPPSMPTSSKVVYNNGFTENTTAANSSPSLNAQGAPGWQVSLPGLYKIEATVSFYATTSSAPSAPLGFVGIGSPYDVFLTMGLNSQGQIVNQMASFENVWTVLLPPVNNQRIRVPISGFMVIRLVPSDVLYIGLRTTNQRQAITLENARLDIQWVSD